MHKLFEHMDANRANSLVGGLANNFHRKPQLNFNDHNYLHWNRYQAITRMRNLPIGTIHLWLWHKFKRQPNRLSLQETLLCATDHEIFNEKPICIIRWLLTTARQHLVSFHSFANQICSKPLSSPHDFFWFMHKHSTCRTTNHTFTV